MRILFIFPREKPYDFRTVRDLPSGGTEKTVIFLGEAFQKLGHAVEWVTTLEGIEPAVANADAYDAVITQEAELLQAFPNARKVFWSHHFADQPITQRSAAYARAFADKVVTLSRCHAEDFRDKMRLESVTIGHGLWLSETVQGVEKDPYRLIYASTPFRGLERIPDLFHSVKAAEPRATIAICSSMATYGTPEEDAKYQALFDELRSIDGVELLGALNQEALYREYARASYFYYPSTWKESYCLALDEALVHHCTPIVSDVGALKERAQPSDDFIGIFQKNISFKAPLDWHIIASTWEKEILYAS
jgi:glycosyltransferase involved in cell wall biosynthesis